MGLVGIGVLVALALFVLVAVVVARHPHRMRAALTRVDGVPAVRRTRTWAAGHLTTGWRWLVRRFPVAEAVGVALLVGLGVVVVLAVGFTSLLEDVLEGEGIAAFDQPASQWLADHREPWLTTALYVFTQLGSPVALGLLATGVGVYVSRHRRSRLPVVLSLVGAAGIGLVITLAKALVGRDRPPPPVAAITESGYSFPSGHATGTSAIVLLCAWLVTRHLVTSWAGRVAVYATALGFIGLIGFSRVYLGVHYVSDVLAGWLLGTAWACAVAVVGSRWDTTTR
ncbi:phosphatase PAP2 family protein [Lentzea sp. NPDC059081]|uniref:phosphatase PAP2 family protein n=1 Tax=Lentzea sp. NPDC059081 TaxID=3346719 RepID=UPI0036B61E88